MRRILRLTDIAQADGIMRRLWPEVKQHLAAGEVLDMRIKPESRTTAENALLHAIIGDIAKQKEWAGKKRDVETWKRLLVAAWCRVRGDAMEILPALDGHGVDIVPARTSELTKSECAELIDFVYAWGAEAGVVFSEPPTQDKL